MNTIDADLAQVTSGSSASHYLDDEYFTEGVDELVEMGHSAEAAREALTKYVDNTPMWDCPECGHTDIEEAGYATCPICDAPNPSVVVITPRSSVSAGPSAARPVLDGAMGRFTISFDGIPGSDRVACQSCAATITDWRSLGHLNVTRHITFHARLGY